MAWDLFEYLLEGRRRGFSDEVLRNDLLRNGFTEESIQDAFFQLDHEISLYKRQAAQQEEEEDSEEQTVKKRSAFFVLVFSIITVGVYFFVWLVKTTSDLRRNTWSAPSPYTVCWFVVPVFLFVGWYLVGDLSEIVNLIAWAVMIFSLLLIEFIYFWKYSHAIEEISGFSKEWLFALWILLPPIALIVSQAQLNKA